MRSGLYFFISLVIELVAINLALAYHNPLPPVIVALVSWPLLFATIAMIGQGLFRRSGGVNMMEMYNYYNISSMNRNLDQMNQRSQYTRK